MVGVAGYCPGVLELQAQQLQPSEKVTMDKGTPPQGPIEQYHDTRDSLRCVVRQRRWLYNSGMMASLGEVPIPLG